MSYISDRIDILQNRLEEMHLELRSATRCAFSAEDYYALATLAKRCAATAAEIEMLND